MASKSKTSCTKGLDVTDGDTGSGEISINDEMPPMCGNSEVVNETAVVKCDHKVLSDGGTSGLGCKTLSQHEQGGEW